MRAEDLLTGLSTTLLTADENKLLLNCCRSYGFGLQLYSSAFDGLSLITTFCSVGVAAVYYLAYILRGSIVLK